ncbi:MAG TPA: membrane protein insertase YidC [Streptosporangiaceae bacterium]|nr:membrane protein insertase YidC [Streptosporangiaceae bacterium]
MSILNPLADLVAWAIMHIHAGLGALFGPDTGLAWGLSIAVLVIIIRLLLVPLFVKQVHAQRKMAQHAPHLAELRKKYKNDKQRLNEETMKFYKENGVNPLAGCLPMIPQMIVFFSLFYVLRSIADWKPGTKLSYGLTTSVLHSAQQAKIFGVHLGDKLLFSHQAVPLHVAVVIVLTVIVSAATTFMTVRQTSKRGLMQTNVDPDNPMAGMQKYMMYIVPFFSLTGLYWQYGLVLYWVTTNLWTLGQQFFMFRNWTAEDAQAAQAAAATAAASRATQSTARLTSGAAKSAAGSGSGAAKTATGSAKTATNGTRSSSAAKPAASSAKTATGSAKTVNNGTRSSGAAKPATAGASAAANGRTSTSRPASATAGAAAASPRTGSARGDAAAATPNGQNGGAKRGLLRLGRPKPEPVVEPEVPATKVVRQQTSKQARSKRSGKR